MKELVIIGNGFDLHHGLRTSYGAFAGYAESHSPSVYEVLSRLFLASHDYMGFDRRSDFDEGKFVYERWCDFESCLGILDDEEFGQLSRQSVSEYMQELGMEETIVEEFIENISSILDTFQNWVAEIDLPTSNRRGFWFDASHTFVNFNYTETLETFYGVDTSRIFYIHGRRGTNDQLIVGHDSDPPRAQHKDDLPDIQHNPYYSYLRRTRKPVSDIAPRLQKWLQNSSEITRISVRGHSLGSVDFPYFELISSVCPKAEWSFSYYSDDGLDEIRRTVRALGLPPERVTSVAKLSEFEANPKTMTNALTNQLELKLPLSGDGLK